MAWVYILLCSNKKYYVGSTRNLEKRMADHFGRNGAKFTKRYRPISLEYSQKFASYHEAWQAENRIKNWSNAKKRALIDGNLDALRYLAKKPKFRSK